MQEKIIKDEIDSLPERERKKIKIPSPLYIFKSRGCSKCAKKGTKGRTGLYEILVMTEELEKTISTEPSEYKIIEEAKRQGMITLKQDGILKVLEGLVSLEEILKVVETKEEII